MLVKINSTGEIKEVKQVGDKLFDKENNCYSLSQVILLNGWHPASEFPVIPEGKFSVSVIAYCNTPSGIYAPVEIAYTRTRG